MTQPQPQPQPISVRKAKELIEKKAIYWANKTNYCLNSPKPKAWEMASAYEAKIKSDLLYELLMELDQL